MILDSLNYLINLHFLIYFIIFLIFLTKKYYFYFIPLPLLLLSRITIDRSFKGDSGSCSLTASFSSDASSSPENGGEGWLVVGFFRGIERTNHRCSQWQSERRLIILYENGVESLSIRVLTGDLEMTDDMAFDHWFVC